MAIPSTNLHCFSAKSLSRTLKFFLFVGLCFPPTSDAHRSGCHRWYSCPSDRGTYECGDSGHCSQCPCYASGGWKPPSLDSLVVAVVVVEVGRHPNVNAR